MAASYPVLPLSSGHLLTVGVTSYEGEVFFGLNADRDAVSDLDVLAQCLLDALEELLDTTVRATSVRQPTRKASPAARRAAAKKAAARQESARKAAGQKRAAVRTLVSRAAGSSGRPGPAAPAAAKTAPAERAGQEGGRQEGARPKKTPGEEGPGQEDPGQEGPGQEGPGQEGRRGQEGPGEGDGRARMTQLVFVPLDRAEVVALRSGAGRSSYPGCAATAGLAGTLGAGHRGGRAGVRRTEQCRCAGPVSDHRPAAAGGGGRGRRRRSWPTPADRTAR